MKINIYFSSPKRMKMKEKKEYYRERKENIVGDLMISRGCFNRVCLPLHHHYTGCPIAVKFLNNFADFSSMKIW